MNTQIPARSKILQFEFVALMAMLMSLAALAIDAMLPALPIIGKELQVLTANGTQQVIIFLFLGLSLGQLFYGPLSDTFGRKPFIYVGISIFIIGCLVSIYAQSFSMMLFGRFLQGLGISSPRVITMAIVRDQYVGNKMAKIMSLIMVVFVLVPALAPSLGQAILLVSKWRTIFWFFIFLSSTAMIWFAMRQKETLSISQRKSFSFSHFKYATKRIFTTPVAIGYTVASGLVFGAFIGYLVSSQQIFQDIYKLKDEFPFYFGVLAISIGCASFLNSKLVEKYGMIKLTYLATIGVVINALIFLIIIANNKGVAPFPIFMIYMILSFGCIGFLFGNFNSLAMEPLGDIAGSATAVISTVQNIISLSLGSLIAHSFQNTLYPLSIGFLSLSLASLGIIKLVHRFELK